MEALENVSALVVYHICGPVKDMEYWQRCLETDQKLPPNVTVHYHGDIPLAKVYEFYRPDRYSSFPVKVRTLVMLFMKHWCRKTGDHQSFYTWQQLDEKQAGMNIELTVSAVSMLLKHLRMDQATCETWSKAAVDYAADSINIPSLQESYRLLFSVVGLKILTLNLLKNKEFTRYVVKFILIFYNTLFRYTGVDRVCNTGRSCTVRLLPNTSTM